MAGLMLSNMRCEDIIPRKYNTFFKRGKVNKTGAEGLLPGRLQKSGIAIEQGIDTQAYHHTHEVHRNLCNPK